MRRIIPAAIAVALLVAGCGNSVPGLDDVKVSGGKTPTLDVDKGFKATKTDTKVLKKGTGHAIVEGDAVTLDYVAVNGRTGKAFDSSFKADGPMVATIKTGSILPGFVKSLKGQKVGSRILAAIPPKDGFGSANEQLDIKKNDTMVFLFDIVKAEKVPEIATGKAQKLPDTLPKLKLNDKKQPSKFAKTDKTAPKKGLKMSTTVAIQGEGAVIKSGQTVSMQYVGQVYPSGVIFDESWSSQAMVKPIGAGGLIKCWDEQIPGQKVGSRLILVCPADVAYGDAKDKAPIKPGDTLIFAVDLLSAF